MRRRAVDKNIERQFLTALVTDDNFLAQAGPALLARKDVGTALFQRVSSWCLDYWERYHKAPQSHIESIFRAWADQDDTDPREAETVQDLLEDLSREHDDKDPGPNTPYLIDELSSYLSLKSLDQLREDLERHILQGSPEEAIRTLHNYHPVDLGQGAGVDPLADREVWQRTFSDPAETLLTFPSDAGQFFNKAMTRDALVGIQGPEKRGKTFWCMEFAIRALRQRRKVAFFQVGDLSERQIMKRLGVRLASLPLWADQCGEVEVPRKIILSRSEEGEIIASTRTKPVHCPSPISYRDSVRAVRKFLRSCAISKTTPHFMISVHPTCSINVRGIEGILDRWRVERGFIPDVIIIDYADILSPEEGSSRRDEQDQINETWASLRRLSQERHCLVLVPTQANASSYDATTQSMKHFSRDKRKMAHVTGMIGLNQTAKEKELGVMRLNWIVLRESNFNTYACLYVGQCLTLGRAYCCASLVHKEAGNEEAEED